MPDIRNSTVPRDFEALTKKQKAFVRRLAWETVKTEAPFVVIIPSIMICLGVIIGIVAGALLGHLLFSGHTSLPLLICVVMGASVGAWIGRTWMWRQCQAHFREVIREHKDEISQIVQ